MSEIIFCVLVAFGLTYFLIPRILQYLRKKKIHDKPDERKVHTEEKPSLGGIAIFVGFFSASLIFAKNDNLMIIWPELVAICAVLAIGIFDDIYNVSPKVKLLVQIPASLLVIHFLGIRIESFYGLFGVGELPIWFSYAITLFTFIVITNALNLIDGLDGLAGTVTLIGSLVFGFWFYGAGSSIFALLCFSLAGATFAFLFYNWEPSKIFMGDTGALFIGFFFSTAAINFIKLNGQLPLGHELHFENVATAAICVISVPMFDTLRVFFIRVMQKRSPFSPDQNHVHHMLMKLGFGHGGTVRVLGFVSLVFVGLAYLGRDISDNVTLPAYSALAFTSMYFLANYSKQHESQFKNKENAQTINGAVVQSNNVNTKKGKDKALASKS